MVTEFFKPFLWCFAGFSFPLVLLFGSWGLFYSFILSIIVSPLLVYIAGKIGSAAGRLYSGSGSTVSDRELALVELEKVRILYGQRKYDQALRKIKLLNRTNPEIPEALYLQAHILWEGFRDKRKAISCLERLLAVSAPGSEYFNWAANFRDELEVRGEEQSKDRERV